MIIDVSAKSQRSLLEASLKTALFRMHIVFGGVVMRFFHCLQHLKFWDPALAVQGLRNEVTIYAVFLFLTLLKSANQAFSYKRDGASGI